MGVLAFFLAINDGTPFPPEYYHGTNEHIIRVWYGIYLCFTWLSACVITLYIGRKFNRKNKLPSNAVEPTSLSSSGSRLTQGKNQ
jgi:hypothetical protein